MENEGEKIRFRNGGKKYVAEFISDDFVSEKSPHGFIKGLIMFRIWDEHQKEILGCISFTVSLLTSLTRTGSPIRYKTETFANLLHYLPFDPIKCKAIYPSCYEYRFDRDLDENMEEDGLYHIKTDDDFESTFQRLIFGDTFTNSSIQEAAKEVMFNNWEDHPDTNVAVETLVNILPVAEINLIKNLKLLLKENKIDAVTSPSDPQKLISVGLRPSTIRELDGEVKSKVKYPSMVKNIYGPNIETTTHGANSPVIINVGKIETVFQSLQKEIRENQDLKDEEKEEISQVVKELEAEITKEKNPKKVAKLLKKLKISAGWIWQKILTNPYVSGIIIELLSKAIL